MGYGPAANDVKPELNFQETIRNCIDAINELALLLQSMLRNDCKQGIQELIEFNNLAAYTGRLIAQIMKALDSRPK